MRKRERKIRKGREGKMAVKEKKKEKMKENERKKKDE